MPLSSDKKVYIIVSVLVLVLVTMPYLYAGIQAGPEHHFGGFLLNPIDGNSYVAKMVQGWEGRWRFTLPYTHDPGEGAYFFLFYLFLGHLARIFHLPLLIVFHMFRFFGAGLLLVSLARFFHLTLPTSRGKQLAFSVAALGSGLGWMVIPWGLFTADLWVAETYPFLSAYANPHFPMGLAAMLVLIKPGKKDRYLFWGLLTCLLALCLPFGVVLVILVHAISILFDAFSGEKGFIKELLSVREVGVLLVVIGCGLPFLIYEIWAVSADPVLSEWHAQNLTPSPPLWNTLLSLSPPLIFALLGIKRTWQTPSGRVLIYWLFLGAALIYFPWSLQRRFLLGYYIPLTGMAVLGIRMMADRFKIKFRTWGIILIIMVLPTNLIILTSAIQAVGNHDPRIYITQNEMAAFNWITESTREESVILAAPETGLYIPAYTGRKVIYGHPFETTKAEKKEEMVKNIYGGEWSIKQNLSFFEKYGIDYIYYGPREKEIGAFTVLDWMRIAYRNPDIRIYKINP